MNDAEILRLLGVVDQETHRQVEIEAARYIAKADHYYKPLKGLIVPTFKYDLRGRTAGYAQAKYSTQDFYIRLNNDALLSPEFKDYIFRQTLPHEIAHTVVQQLWPKRYKAHGWKWQEVMHLFNVEPKTTHNLPLKQVRKTRKFTYLCACGREHQLGLNRHRKEQARPGTYVCSYCEQSMIYTGEEVNTK